MDTSIPGPTIGVVGGGQLGRMMGEEASALGIELVVLDPTPDSPASPVVRDQITADFDDRDALMELAQRVDYLTYEIELADPDVLEEVSDETAVEVHPAPGTLRLIEDKLIQKRRFQENGVTVPGFREVSSSEDIHDAIDEFGLPLMLKARLGGYDGRGNVPITSESEIDEVMDQVEGAIMVETFLDFDRELSVIGCKGPGGNELYPVTETIHEEEILRETVSPARTDDKVKQKARETALKVLDILDGRGVYGIELFELDQEIYLNEVAPRPHNSGHWTIEGAYTSQFEQHLRAVAGMPLGSTEIRGGTVSKNILGDVDEEKQARLTGVEEILSREKAYLHWYGKKMVRPLRKMGHFTITDIEDDLDSALNEAREIRGHLVFD